tara:strand:+ start:3081 stop:4268 length:1188 start_codon:yes stop_codon:yes gene_type:complete
MKKKLVILYPYKFTSFEYFKFEIDKFKYDIKIIDLSYANKIFSNKWKSIRHKKVIAPKNIPVLIKTFNSINSKDTFILNFLAKENNLFTLISKFIIRKKNIFDINIDEKGWSLQKVEKNYTWFKEKLLKINLNFFFYLSSLANILFKIFNFILNNKNQIYFHPNSRSQYRYIHFFDYSNSLIKKKKNIRKRYVLYLDNGGPYFQGDTQHMGNKHPNNSYYEKKNIREWYMECNKFFKKIEKDFNCHVVIIPHPKYKSSSKKIKTHNPYFREFIVNNKVDALTNLGSNALFYLSRGSTASAYAVLNKKPMIFFYSSNFIYGVNELKVSKQHALDLGTECLDFRYYNFKKIKKLLKINLKKYDLYFKKNLVPRKALRTKKNYELISNFINNFKINVE